MCLAVPLRIVEIKGQTAVVESGGIRREAVVAFIDHPRLGDYVLVHAGFAIRKWSEADVREYQAILSGVTADPAAAAPAAPGSGGAAE